MEKTTLQCDQELKHFKATNGHATRNVLKRHQSCIDGVVILETPSSSQFEPTTPTSYPSPFLDNAPFGNDGEKSMTKSEMLESQSRNMAIMASHFSTTSQIETPSQLAKWRLRMKS